MSTWWQTLALVVLILLSLTLTRTRQSAFAVPANTATLAPLPVAPVASDQNFSFSFESAALGLSPAVATVPMRRWEVLDPTLAAQAVLVQSLDEGIPLLRFHPSVRWPIASITKLLTAAAVFDEVGVDKQITISPAAVATEGEAGELKKGEVYTSGDLLKIMLLASSNDAAAAFEEYLGGAEAFAKLANQKAAAIGMADTILHDGSGLSDLNESTADDLLKLVRYVAQEQPQLFAWTRLERFIAQPINDTTSHTVSNINPLVSTRNFLGGKTGTSPEAKENLVSVFTFHGRRLAVVILGAESRIDEVDQVLAWIDRAFQFP